MKTHGRTNDGNEDQSGDGNESSRSGDGSGGEDGNGNGNEDGIREGGGEVKKRKKTQKHVDAIRHFHSAGVIISADRR